jgi:hypothetical protein
VNNHYVSVRGATPRLFVRTFHGGLCKQPEEIREAIKQFCDSFNTAEAERERFTGALRSREAVKADAAGQLEALIRGFNVCAGVRAPLAG